MQRPPAADAYIALDFAPLLSCYAMPPSIADATDAIADARIISRPRPAQPLTYGGR